MGGEGQQRGCGSAPEAQTKEAAGSGQDRFYRADGGVNLADYVVEARSGWGTDAAAFAGVVAEFERALPGFWWSVGQCSVGAHASCAVDGKGCQADLLARVHAGDPLDTGFHCDTDGGSPAEALRNVMDQALAYLATSKGGGT